ncbi:hypothetical protein NLU13_1566 [Sarocladium strictum]|uniref:TeaA receptor TeaR n=1 Tax=Sarocladium strictum TaxID=5046 RepID=A0AA39GST6_SARSR|nr:hypothetical protein NLU13_1566 [Sarocladium strictum]
MAAISSTHGAAMTTLTPPTSSHGSNHDAPWSYPTGTNDDPGRHKSISPQQTDRGNKSPSLAQNGFEAVGQPADRTTRKMQSSESFNGDRNGYPADSTNGRSTYADLEGQSYHKSTEDQKRDAAQAGLVPGNDDKWIHRDKLARIESEELQAAGFFVPRSRAPSKQRRERSQVSYRRGTDASEQGYNRSRKNSAAVEQKTSTETTSPPAWDLRTPEEIAEEEANAYFTTNTQKGGSRIPVAKSSLAPISTDHLERAQPVVRRQTDSSDGETLSYSKTRSRSASASGKDALGIGSAATSKRPATDTSPKKVAGGSRKASSQSKPPTTASTQGGRPKTRSSSAGTRPSTRSGEKQPEGDPPWLVDAYKPDPRLPPDQQLLPTVARRLQQEQWEKEGKEAGDVFDKEFRPLNDNVFLRPAEAETAPTDEERRSQEQTNSEWPLKPETAAKSPTLRQGSYSTMPKINDKPPGSPLPSPRSPVALQPPMQQQPQADQQQTFQRIEQEDPEPKKGGCGCCVVM